MTERRKLLFTGGGGAGNEAIYRMWQDRYDLHFADADILAINPTIPAERRHSIPMASNPDFVDGLAALCERLRIDVLVPGVDAELPFMQAVSEHVPGIQSLVPETNYVRTMLDKLETVRALIAHGLDAPRTDTIDGIKEIGFPCIAKPRWGRGSRGCQILRDSEQADAYRRLSGLPPEKIVVQELIEGDEFTVMMVADRNAHLAVVVPVKIDVKRGITLRGETDHNVHVITACRAIHKTIPARGCYNIQLMRTTNGRIVPFEINPRISTTFCLGLAAGIDPVSVFLHGALNAAADFTSGIKLNRAWHNFFEEG